MRSLVKEGYETFSGVKMTAAQAESYNAVQTRINSFLLEGLEPPQELLNGSHNLLMSIALQHVKYTDEV
jgi:broad specificity phosphatase PhoE